MENFKKILADLKLQKSRALSGTKFGSWILVLEDIETAPVEVVSVKHYKSDPMIRRTFVNLEEACKAFPKLDHFYYGMRGQVDGKPALRFECEETNRRLST
jgi:hypothetical protein